MSVIIGGWGWRGFIKSEKWQVVGGLAEYEAGRLPSWSDLRWRKIDSK